MLNTHDAHLPPSLYDNALMTMRGADRRGESRMPRASRQPLKRIKEPLSSAIRQHLLEYCLDRVRRNPKFSKSRHLRRCHGVDLHQFHLMAREERTREYFGGPCQCVPNGKRDCDHSGPEASLVSNDSKKLLVRVDAGAAELEDR